MNDLINRQDAIEAMNSETVSTNPEHFKSSEKFIKFMDDSDIASFGEWQWANGFNTALVATRIQLKKLPSAQQNYDSEMKREFIRMAEYVDCLLQCSDEQKEMLIGFISRLAEYMPWVERD